MDFFDPNNFQEFFNMDRDARREAIGDWLANVAEPWQGNTQEDILARSIIASMHALTEAIFQIEDLQKVNRHILGLWLHTYTHISRGFQTLAALSDIRKSFEKKPEGEE